jgi:hypothetical protein
MVHNLINQKVLSSTQTKTFLFEHMRTINDLSKFENMRLEQNESRRALIANFAYCWTVAEAAGLNTLTDLIELGIIQMHVQLGLKLNDVRKSVRNVANNRLQEENLHRAPRLAMNVDG